MSVMPHLHADNVTDDGESSPDVYLSRINHIQQAQNSRANLVVKAPILKSVLAKSQWTHQLQASVSRHVQL